MAQFGVYKNPNKANARTVPFLLDVQSDFLSSFPTRVVVPLVVSEQVNKVPQRLNPHFLIDGAGMVMMTEQLASVPKQILGTQVTSLVQHRDDIVSAMDFLVLGF